MATAPFPEAQFEALIYILLGAFIALTVAASLYIWKLQKIIQKADEKEKEEELRTDNIGLSKRAQDVLNSVLDEPKHQNELPGELEVSKATVSQAISELSERGLIKRKKRGNTYLVEPHRENLKEQQK